MFKNDFDKHIHNSQAGIKATNKCIFRSNAHLQIHKHVSITEYNSQIREEE